MVAQDIIFRDVWASNLDEEFAELRKIVRKSNAVITNIEFPGICMTPIGTFFSQEHFSYQQLLVNVNALKPLQIGFTFIHKPIVVFQFNFHFNINEDMCSDEAYNAYQAAGYDFEKHNNEGIDLLDFGELLTTSGLVVSKLTWASFHAAFDFGYIIRSLNGGSLPADIREFYKLFRKYFSTAYDIKYMMQHANATRRGLTTSMNIQETAEAMQLHRWGKVYNAGSNSQLAARIFFFLKDDILKENWQELSHNIRGLISGIGGKPVLPPGAVIQNIFAPKSYNGQTEPHRVGTGTPGRPQRHSAASMRN
ncbi:unnamed protein product [Bursaphelenchus xylophilus]|uniref:poly(A)-specific ribonuclease n=1 Tax=Bursaphelenchus xylophilus TaxID=6326 RepID=A0A1I7S3C7_BURXY|nr:unnamed protein product [Bursaphelenchus xylophilus]CAG9116216.1 unnamed protein product [Bursaphelenchus xylophilus]